MKNFTTKIVFISFVVVLMLSGAFLQAQTLTRGPYLQVGKQDSITIRWRTSAVSNSKVTWGTVFGTYPNSLTQDVATTVTEHIVRIGGLSADTKYWYTIGTTTLVLQQTNTNYFLTLPPSNTTRKLRFLAIGDCGNASTNQVDVKNSFINYIGSNDVDAMLTIGDNAYSSGTDAEFQLEFFDIYKNDLLKYYKLYPAPGNHDYGNSTANNTKTGSTPANSMPYHLNFTVPTAGEIGGVPSGVKNYYSYNIGDVHFISLDSYGKDGGNLLYDTSGAQATWLKADLAANTKRWTVAYFHHPPYTKTSHTSDTEMDLVAVREKFVRILERNGVDLIICGHAHGYERSYLLKGFYNTFASPLLDANFSAVAHTATGNTQNGKYDGTANACPYTYNSGQYNHGSIYVVSGSAGQLGGTTAGYPQNCMYYSNVTNGGCLYFEVDSNRLDAKFISYTGTGAGVAPLVRDQFTIFKDVRKKQTFNVTTNTPLLLTASWRGNYYWPNNSGATSQAVSIPNSVNGIFTYYARDISSGNCIEDTFVVNVSGTLPINLSSFNATLNKDIVALDWSTAQEQNNKYFTIEKSIDGINFSFLGKVNGAGISSSPKMYHLIDYTPLEGINYYRLSQTDFDGNIKYHDIKRVSCGSSKGFSAGILNNGNGQVRVVIHSAKAGNINMMVLDILGKEILQEKFSVNNGGGIKNLYLNPGVYVLVMINDKGEKITNKIIVQ
jgi:predicted MPP superfamily phosphohydrolase